MHLPKVSRFQKLIITILALIFLLVACGAPSTSTPASAQTTQDGTVISTTPLTDGDGDVIGYLYQIQYTHYVCFTSISVGGPDYRGTGTSTTC